ncbi:hypothetical protein KFE98_07925 [bacterium SCSIO 12741]|nr:hypothetical protein KFE98_07925 [bacterium SCSIO 12741]
MWKSISGIGLGFLTSGIVIVLVEALNYAFFPELPDLTEIEDKQKIAEAMSQIPMAALFIIMLAHALGSFSAGVITSLFVPSSKIRLGVVTGFLVLFMGIVNLVMVPHPTWFMAVDLAVFVPMAYLGARLGEARS